MQDGLEGRRGHLFKALSAPPRKVEKKKNFSGPVRYYFYKALL
jgi:hypothetical protein